MRQDDFELRSAWSAHEDCLKRKKCTERNLSNDHEFNKYKEYLVFVCQGNLYKNQKYN